MLTSKDIITKRDTLSENITRNWDIIKSENVVFRGYKRNYDMKLVLDNILTLCKERIEVKLQSLALNLGFEDIDDLPEDNNYATIYAISELKEIHKQLGIVPTIDPEIIKKYGKKKMRKTQILSRAYITTLRNTIQIQINTLTVELENFNSSHSLKMVIVRKESLLQWTSLNRKLLHNRLKVSENFTAICLPCV